jgi:pimeloyl-ACP methyl ester carboxylesterase
MGDGTHGMVDAWKQLAPISAELEARLLANDLNAPIAYQRHRLHFADDVLDPLPSLICPWKLMCGDLDTLAPYSEVAEYASRLPEGSLITLPGLNHLEAFQVSSRWGDRTRFADGCFNGSSTCPNDRGVP